MKSESGGNGGVSSSPPLPTVGVAAVLIVGGLAALGISGDLLTRLVRNDPEAVAWPLGTAVIVVAAAAIAHLWLPAKGRAWADTVAVVVVVFCLATTLVAGVDGSATREVPAVSLQIVGSDPLRIEAEASGDALRADEQILLLVFHASDRGQCFSPEPGADPTRLLAQVFAGPNSTGAATTKSAVMAPPGAVWVCAHAQLKPRAGDPIQGVSGAIRLPGDS